MSLGSDLTLLPTSINLHVLYSLTGTAITTFSVFDPDVDETNIRYILDSDVTGFALRDATLVTTQVLDFETQTEVSLAITVLDKGNLTFTKVNMIITFTYL